MTTLDVTTPTARLISLAERRFGPSWLTPFSELARINRRTLQRIVAAADAGEDHPSAAGVLAAAREVLVSEILDADDPSQSVGRRISEGATLDEIRPLWERLIGPAARHGRSTFPPDALPVGPIDGLTMAEVVWRAQEREQGLLRLLQYALAAPPSSFPGLEDRRRAAIAEAADATGALFVHHYRRPEAIEAWTMLRPPQAIFGTGQALIEDLPLWPSTPPPVAFISAATAEDAEALSARAELHPAVRRVVAIADSVAGDLGDAMPATVPLWVVAPIRPGQERSVMASFSQGGEGRVVVWLNGDGPYDLGL